MSKLIDLTGKRFGRLFVIARNGTAQSGHALWICKCECGNTRVISSNQLISGTQSCGCLQREKAAEFAKNRTNIVQQPKRDIGKGCRRLHQAYKDMNNRCYNPNNKNYKSYGKRGITVCDEWKKDFYTFRDWAISHGYADDLTLDRKDVNGNYEPSNCRWTTVKEQNNNRRNNRIVTYNGETMTLHELSERYTNVPYRTLWARLNAGWSLADAVEQPIRRSINGRYIA